MRIGFDGAYMTSRYPGVGRFSNGLLKALSAIARNKLEIVLLLPDQPDRYTRFRLDEFTRNSGVQVEVGGGKSLPIRQWRLKSRVPHLNLDLYYSPFYLPASLHEIPTVATIYDLIPLHFQTSMTALRRILYKVVLHLTVQNSSQIVTTTEFSRDDISAKFPSVSDRIIVVYPGLDEGFQPIRKAEWQVNLQRYSLPERYVLYIGSDKPHKNLETLLHGWRLLRDSDATLVLAGFWQRPLVGMDRQIREMSQDTKIRILGPIPEEDLPSLYSGAELFVFPSLIEGFGFPALEAMACGCPVLCSDIPSLREVAGRAAYFFNPTDAEELTDQLSSLLANGGLRAKLREEGLDHSGRFQWQRTAREMMNCYKQFSKGK